MALNNYFTKKQLDVFRMAGFKVYENDQDNQVSIVKYPEHELKALLLIQIDYDFRQLLIHQQNIFNFRQADPPKYCAALPDDISDTISILKFTKVFNPNLLTQLWNC
jgi:hypothetical protein